MPDEIVKPIPKRFCLIKLMFAIDSDEQALQVKKQVDESVKDLKDKRYSFEITES